MAAARVASALSVPAISSPSPENAAVPRTRSSSTASGFPCGDHPSAKAMTVSSTIWSTSVTSTDSVLAVISAQRGSGEAPSRLRTP